MPGESRIGAKLGRGVVAALELLTGRWRSGRSMAAWQVPPGPAEANLHLMSGRDAFRHGDLETAMAEYGKAVELAPDWLEAIEAQAEALDRSGQRERAAEAYEKLRHLRAVTRFGTPDRGYLARQRGQFTAEVFDYGQVGHRIDRMVMPLIARANALLAEGKTDAALLHYDRVLRMNPMLVDVRALRAEALLSAGRFREAASGFDKVLSANRRNPWALSGRAIARMAQGKVADANATWLRQFDVLPSSDQAAARACVAMRLADYQRALPELEQAIAESPHDAYWPLYRLTALHRLGRPAVAAETGNDLWPAPLLALYAGRIDETALLAKADTPARQAEAAFQLGVLAASVDKEAARHWWQRVVEQGPADLIEYAAARNELARLGT